MIAEVSYYTDVAFKIGGGINGLWGFHLAALTAALGWGIASRQWKAGLRPPIAAVAGATVLGFGVISCISLERLYGRINSALDLAARAWGDAHPGVKLPTLFQHWPFDMWLYIALDAVVALVVAALFSELGRPAPLEEPPKSRAVGAGAARRR